MSGVQQIEVAAGEGDQRLDRWLRRKFPHVGQGRVEKMCRKGELRVDGGRVKANTRLEVGQVVRIPPLPDEAAAPRVKFHQAVSDNDSKMIQSCVIYQDDHIIALNKPPGLPSQGGSKQTKHVDGLAEALKFGREDKPRLVHRLDKDTSGVLLLARSREVAKGLTDAFRARETKKLYWAIVAGVPFPRMGTVKWGLMKAPGGGKGEGEKMLCVHPARLNDYPDAKRAVTDYAVIENLAGRAAWVGLVPVTGRTHQLRAHMAEMGHPIVGDGKYGGSGQENLGDGWGAMLGGEISKKLHLHARSIVLTHPVTGKELVIEAELPDHMRRTWKTLGFRAEDAPFDPFEPEA